MPLYSGEVGEEDLVIFLGPDQHGVPLEVVGVELAGDELLVIHAMRLRPRYADDFARVMKSRQP